MSKRIVITLDDEEYELFKQPKNMGARDSVRGRNILMNWLMKHKEQSKDKEVSAVGEKIP